MWSKFLAIPNNVYLFSWKWRNSVPISWCTLTLQFSRGKGVQGSICPKGLVLTRLFCSSSYRSRDIRKNLFNKKLTFCWKLSQNFLYFSFLVFTEVLHKFLFGFYFFLIIFPWIFIFLLNSKKDINCVRAFVFHLERATKKNTTIYTATRHICGQPCSQENAICQ